MSQAMIRLARALLAAGLVFTGLAAHAQGEGDPGITRLLVTETRVRPEKIEEWLALQRNEVVPALKKVGVKHYTLYQTVIGDTTEFVSVRPLPTFAEFNGPDVLDRGLGVAKAAGVRARLRACTVSQNRSIENRNDEFFLDPGDAQTLFVSKYRAMPGKARDYMNFVRDEMMPPARKAQQNGTFAGWAVTTSVQGGEPGIITLDMYYNDFTPLDGPPPIAKTLGPEGTAQFLQRGAGLITQLEQRILKRLPEQSF